MQSHYDNYENGSSGSSDNNPELIFTTYSTVEFNLTSAFGTESEYGQSLGIAFEDTELVDGCLYADVEKEKFKLFSWQESNDMSPAERFDRGEEPSADDASDFIRKTYANNDKEYELVAARVQEVTDEDGEVVVEASSKRRDIDFLGDNEADFGEWEDLGGDTVEIGDFVSWYNGTADNGPSTSAKNLAETLTVYGDRAVQDEDDIFNWLNDDSGSDILRDELNGRRVRFFTVTRPGENYSYNLPIIEDVETGQRIRPNNYDDDSGSDGGTGNSNSGVEESDAVQEAAELDEQSYPEPIADFISSGRRLELTEERAENLLDEMIADDDNSLTGEMVSDNGGRQQIVNQIT